MIMGDREERVDNAVPVGGAREIQIVNAGHVDQLLEPGNVVVTKEPHDFMQVVRTYANTPLIGAFVVPFQEGLRLERDVWKPGSQGSSGIVDVQHDCLSPALSLRPALPPWFRPSPAMWVQPPGPIPCLDRGCSGCLPDRSFAGWP